MAPAQQNERAAQVCGNCETALRGPYCHMCGQRERSPVRELIGVLRDGADEFLALDGKLWRSVFPLFFRPGWLTKCYLDGQRVSFVRPLRMYLALSVILFLLMSWQTHIGKSESPGRPTVGVNIELSEAERTKAKNTSAFQFNVSGKPWHGEKNPLKIDILPELGNRWLNQVMMHIERSSKRVIDDPDLLVSAVYRILPTAIFLLLPIGALLLKLLYGLTGRVYAEHLLAAVQLHSFFFLAVISMFVLGSIGAWLHTDTNWAMPMVGVLIGVICFWIPVYFWLYFKRVYGQGWFLTSAKLGLFSLSYFLLLGLTFMSTLLVGLVSL